MEACLFGDDDLDRVCLPASTGLVHASPLSKPFTEQSLSTPSPRISSPPKIMTKTVAAAVLFLGERFTLINALGLLVLIIGVVSVHDGLCGGPFIRVG